MAQQEATLRSGAPRDFSTEEEDAPDDQPAPGPEQQVFENFLGLNEANGQNKDSYLSKLLRPLLTAPLYPAQLVQVSRKHKTCYESNTPTPNTHTPTVTHIHTHTLPRS